MLEHAITQLVQLFPRGTTDGQLLWRLRGSGLRNDPSAVLAALVALAGRGEIRRVGGRWIASGRATTQAGPVAAAAVGDDVNAALDVLRAVRMDVGIPPDALDCHSACNPDPQSASNIDPLGDGEEEGLIRCSGWVAETDQALLRRVRRGS